MKTHEIKITFTSPAGQINTIVQPVTLGGNPKASDAMLSALLNLRAIRNW